MALYLTALSLILILGLPVVVFLELRKRNPAKIASKRIAKELGFTFEDAAQSINKKMRKNAAGRDTQTGPTQALQNLITEIIYMASPWKIHGNYKGVRCTIECSTALHDTEIGEMLTFSAEHAAANLDTFFLSHKSLVTIPMGGDNLHPIPLVGDSAKKLSLFSIDDSSVSTWLLKAERLTTFARLLATQPNLILSENTLSWMESGAHFEYTEAHLREKLDSLTTYFNELNLTVINT